ncbi:MAG TPA: hypothetical protein VM925_01825 [Labilithrix sp.]|nr:hypothetical protein [Labilithrix sp.]
MALITQVQEETQRELAKRSVQKLRRVLVSTATFAPLLAIPKWEESLPSAGAGNLASGGVPLDRLDDLIAILREGQAEGELAADDDWTALVLAAATIAKENGATSSRPTTRYSARTAGRPSPTDRIRREPRFVFGMVA